MSDSLFRLRIPLLHEQLHHLGLEVALNDYLTFLGRATYTATRLEQFGQCLEVVIGADEAAYDSHRLTPTMVLLHLHTQLLLLPGERLYLGLIISHVTEVRIGRVHHLQAALPVIVFSHILFQVVNERANIVKFFVVYHIDKRKKCYFCRIANLQTLTANENYLRRHELCRAS